MRLIRMGYAKKMITVVLTVLTMCGLGESKAAVYEVGDRVGWTSSAADNYEKWAADKNFRVGDVIVFNYDNQFHNVKQVSQQDFESCNSTAPTATYKTGSDFISLDDKQAHLYFICGFPGHCQSGQKIHIVINPKQPPPSPTAPPSPTTLPSPTPTMEGPVLSPSATNTTAAAHLSFSSPGLHLLLIMLLHVLH